MVYQQWKSCLTEARHSWQSVWQGGMNPIGEITAPWCSGRSNVVRTHGDFGIAPRPPPVHFPRRVIKPVDENKSA